MGIEKLAFLNYGGGGDGLGRAAGIEFSVNAWDLNNMNLAF